MHIPSHQYAALTVQAQNGSIHVLARTSVPTLLTSLALRAPSTGSV